jgi:antitoxin (DNA-binding transcriptional repressor) of toxin-antitoxin stability system
MKRLSVSDFKAHLSAYLREVEQGQTYVITEHRRPVAEVHRCSEPDRVVTYAEEAFSLQEVHAGPRVERVPNLARDLLNEDRGE